MTTPTASEAHEYSVTIPEGTDPDVHDRLVEGLTDHLWGIFGTRVEGNTITFKTSEYLDAEWDEVVAEEWKKAQAPEEEDEPDRANTYLDPLA